MSPTNGAGWLDALARAGAAHDEEARDAALSAIAHTERVDIYWTTLIGHLATAAVGADMPPADALINVVGILAAMEIPAYAPASNSCKGDRLQREDTLKACRGVASAFENGNNVITEMLGVAIAKRVWPEGSEEWRAAVERRRTYEYRADAWKPLEPVTMSSPQAQAYIALCLEYSREQDSMRRQLIDAGKDPDPPKN